MQLHSLFDAASALIVIGGTSLATVLRCGIGDTRLAFGAIARLFGPRFNATETKAELAGHVQQIRRDGVMRVEPFHLGDEEFDEASDALIGTRSLDALHSAHVAHKRRRTRQSMRAVRTFNQAADLSPVFGLAGTLISLTQLPDSGGGGSFTGAISMAVLTTLYGLILGNLVFAPLARIVARHAAHEEQERQRVLDWLAAQVADALPGAAQASGHGAHGAAATIHRASRAR